MKTKRELTIEDKEFIKDGLEYVFHDYKGCEKDVIDVYERDYLFFSTNEFDNSEEDELIEYLKNERGIEFEHRYEFYEYCHQGDDILLFSIDASSGFLVFLD